MSLPYCENLGPTRFQALLTRDSFRAAVGDVLQHPRAGGPVGLEEEQERNLDGLSGCAFEQGWEWAVEGASKYHPGVGYLCRARPLLRHFAASSSPSYAFNEGDEAFPAVEEEDDAALPARNPFVEEERGREPCKVTPSVCWSSSFGVPVLWFEAVKSSGAPLTLNDLSTCTFFHSQQRPSLFSSSSLSSPSPSSVAEDAPRLPFLSQADHPATGRPSWFVHPCETEGVVGEVLDATGKGEEGEGEEGDVRWLRAWMMVVSSVVDLRE
ncbi:hypothetical protein JCM6882_004155 [Rhodosporidiobolus microsporus]